MTLTIEQLKTETDLLYKDRKLDDWKAESIHHFYLLRSYNGLSHIKTSGR